MYRAVESVWRFQLKWVGWVNKTGCQIQLLPHNALRQACQLRSEQQLGHLCKEKYCGIGLSVIMAVRQRFGDGVFELGLHDRRSVPLHWGDPGSIPFVGPTKDYAFSCPGIDASQPAVLMFQSLGVTFERNVLTINSQIVFGGIPVSSSKDGWNGNVLLVSPNTLEEASNVLHVESRNKDGGGGGKLDDFVLDNVVILYKLGT